MEKIILYYKFVAVADTEVTMFWQRQLCERYGLTGRVIVSWQGINGTLAGNVEGLKAYVRENNRSRDFAGIEYKWSSGQIQDFPRLSIKVRKELVALAPDESFDVFKPSKGLKPKEWHEYLRNNPEVTVLDARNDYESAIGVFDSKNLLTPPIKAFRDIKQHLDSLPKDKPILTYCTGDIRCEYLSAYMRHKGFSEVYHLDGGIVKYGQTFKDKGLWKGRCYVFDRRIAISFANDVPEISNCSICKKPSSLYVNCNNKSCNQKIIVCQSCQGDASSCCPHCQHSLDR